MTVCEKQKGLVSTAKDMVQKEEVNTLKPECTEEVRKKIAKAALEADDLCYNYETGFHYMKQ